MALKSVPFVLLFLISFKLLGSSESKNIRVEKILPHSFIDKTLEEKNFFNRKEWLKQKGDPWDVLDQKYSEAFLAKRTQKIKYQDAVDRAMQYSFHLAYGVEQLTQGKLGIHEALGSILPSLNLTLGDGLPIGVKEVFSGLFGFLLPHNWIKLRQAKLHYNVAKETVKKAALDDYMNIQLVFLELHRVVIKAEIMSFYLCHLQMLEKGFRQEWPELADLLLALCSDVSLDLSYAVNSIGIHHNNLALALVVIQDEENQFSANALRVDLIRDFPKKLKGKKEIVKIFGTKEEYVRKVFKDSLELKIIKILEKVAKHNVGVTASSDLFSDGSTGISPGLGLNIGYGNLPRSLIAHSEKREAQINVLRETINFLDTTRRAYGNYRNSLRSFREAELSVESHRVVFYRELGDLMSRDGNLSKAEFMKSLENLIKAEVTRNDVLHQGLRELSILRRYRLFEVDHVNSYLPTPLDVDAAIDKARHGRLHKKVKSLPEFLKKIKRTRELKKFLSGEFNKVEWLGFGKKSIEDLVRENLDLLLVKKHRSRRFFKTLRKYVLENKISIKDDQRGILKIPLTHPDLLLDLSSEKGINQRI